MANRLTMAEINAILTLHASEHSNREIARLLGVHRETVGKYVAGAGVSWGKPADGTLRDQFTSEFFLSVGAQNRPAMGALIPAILEELGIRHHSLQHPPVEGDDRWRTDSRWPRFKRF